HRVPDLRYAMEIVRLEASAEHHEVARPGCQILRRRCVVRVPPLEQERTPGPRCQYCDDRVVEPTHLAITMHRDAVACGAVVLEPEPVEAHVVSRLNRLLRVREHRMMRIAE